MKKVLVFATLLMLTFMLFACSGNKANTSDGIGSLLSYKKTDAEIADATFEKLVSAIQSKNTTNIVDLFSAAAKTEADVEQEATQLIDFIQGDIVSFSSAGESGVGTDSEVLEGKAKKEIHSAFRLETTEAKYYIAVKECVENEFDNNSVGVLSIYIIESKYWSGGNDYRGDGKWTQGIHIDIPTSYIEIYQIERDTFDIFIKNPSMDHFSAAEPKVYYNVNALKRHLTVEILPAFIEFVSDTTKIQEFLTQNGMNCDVNGVVIIDAPEVALTMWVQSDQEDIFITINEEIEDKPYVYRCYSLSDYNKKYGCLYGSLNANGIRIADIAPISIYSDYADVPLLCVLEAFGSVIDRTNEDLISITFHNKNYRLNIKNRDLYEVGNGLNMLHLYGGFQFIYPAEHDLMVDTNTLSSVMYNMGQPISIDCDRENNIVTITPRS